MNRRRFEAFSHPRLLFALAVGLVAILIALEKSSLWMLARVDRSRFPAKLSP